jgi:hypothetical protein
VQCARVRASMRDMSPVQAERIRARLDDVLKDCPLLPLELKRKMQEEARTFERIANMRATDATLQDAMHKAKEDDKVERNRLVEEARQHCRKAVSLGADADFQHAVKRKIENIMMTGGIEHKGPTAAKPLFFDPGTPHHARA